MGVTPGVEIRRLGAAPLGDPLEFELRGYRLSLRKSEAQHIEINDDERSLTRIQDDWMRDAGQSDLLSNRILHPVLCRKIIPCRRTAKTIRVALVGNPNTGKRTLFTALAGVRQRVGNYPGVTVEKKTGHLRHDGQTFELIDLPGTYSLAPRSPDEMVTVDVLLGPRATTRRRPTSCSRSSMPAIWSGICFW